MNFQDKFRKLAKKEGFSSTIADEFFNELSPKKNILDDLITMCPRMLLIKDKVQKLKSKHHSVLIIGETGTGKEIIARALGEEKGRENFVAVNCAGIPSELLEAEFFGALKGSYTGCLTDRKGYFHVAENGTLFLDEIGDMPLVLQSKLLRVIEYGVYRPLGSSAEIKTNARIITATNQNKNVFRKDFFYRISTIILETIPLRERREDIKLITKYFDKENIIPDNIIEEWTNNFQFEGNVRELKNMIDNYLLFKE